MRITQVISKILEFNKIERNRMKSELVDVAEESTEICDITQAELREKPNFGVP